MLPKAQFCAIIDVLPENGTKSQGLQLPRVFSDPGIAVAEGLQPPGCAVDRGAAPNRRIAAE